MVKNFVVSNNSWNLGEFVDWVISSRLHSCVNTRRNLRGMEKHLKIFPFLKWLSYQSCHIQRAFCRASSSNNFHIYLIDALFYLKLWSSKSKGRKLYIATKYWNQTITMYDTCNRKKKNPKKNTVVTYHCKATLYLALSHLSQTRGSIYDII